MLEVSNARKWLERLRMESSQRSTALRKQQLFKGRTSTLTTTGTLVRMLYIIGERYFVLIEAWQPPFGKWMETCLIYFHFFNLDHPTIYVG